MVTDNQGLVADLNKYRSKTDRINKMICRISRMALEKDIVLRAAWRPRENGLLVAADIIARSYLWSETFPAVGQVSGGSTYARAPRSPQRPTEQASAFLREGRRLRAAAIGPETRDRYELAYEQYKSMIWTLTRLQGDTARLGAGQRMPFPDRRLLIEFCGFISKTTVSASTLKSKLAGLRHAVMARTDRDPLADHETRLVVSQTVKGFERENSVNKRKTRLPVTPELLRRMAAVSQHRSGLGTDELRTFHAVAAIGLFCGLRLGELLPRSKGNWDPEQLPILEDVSFRTGPE